MRGVKCPWLTVATKKNKWTGLRIDDYKIKYLIEKIEKQRYIRTEIQDNMDNPKSFWKTIKNIFPNKTEKTTTPQSIKTDDGKIVTDKLTIAQKFNVFFTRAVSRLLEVVGPTIGSFQMKDLLINVLFYNQFLKRLF